MKQSCSFPAKQLQEAECGEVRATDTGGWGVVSPNAEQVRVTAAHRGPAGAGAHGGWGKNRHLGGGSYHGNVVERTTRVL